MDSQAYKVPELPMPAPAVMQGAVIPDQTAMSSPVTLPAVSESNITQTPVSPTHQILPQQPPQAPPLTAAPADEGADSLDQEWVNKAKSIVQKTRWDPYVESKELGKVKAEYLKIRYNKDLKTIEDH